MFHRKINNLIITAFLFMQSALVFAMPDKLHQAIKINVVTEDGYPLQYLENNEVAGPVTELIRSVLDDAGFNYQIKIKPWARAYKEALEDKNTLIYSMARTSQREPLFKWVGGVMQIRYFLVGLESLELPNPVTLESLKNLPVGAVRNSATHQYLIKKGFTDIYVVSHPSQSIRMLKQGRIQLFPVHYDSFQLSCINMREDCHDIVPKLEMDGPSSSLYFAMSDETDDKVVDRIRASYHKIMKVKPAK